MAPVILLLLAHATITMFLEMENALLKLTRFLEHKKQNILIFLYIYFPNNI